MADFTPASRGVAGSGLGLGIAGTALGIMNGGLGNLLGGVAGTNRTQPVPVTSPSCDMGTALAAVMAGAAAGSSHCSEDKTVNRYELSQESKLAAALNENSLLKANIYNDQKTLETYAYINGQLKEIRDTLCAQAVHNQRTEDSFALARQDIASVRAELKGDIEREAERRCCADNSIVGYVNATFYPKLVADVTAAATTTAQTLYNPIPKCGCCNGG